MFIADNLSIYVLKYISCDIKQDFFLNNFSDGKN